MVKLSCTILFFCSFAFSQVSPEIEFKSLVDDNHWKLRFNDLSRKKWQSKWFLDGLKANVKNTQNGMIFSAGPIKGDDSNHAVLWTKKVFKGNLKIEYEFTKLDSENSQVNIIFIQATGKDPDKKDIFKWKNERTIPHMKTYFDNLVCLHISYAAFDINGEYIRVRKYPRVEGEDFNSTTEIPPAIFNTGMFRQGIKYKITIIKMKNKLFFNIDENGNQKLFSWSLTEDQSVNEGRIGLRHMYTRSSLYENFKVYSN